MTSITDYIGIPSKVGMRKAYQIRFGGEFMGKDSGKATGPVGKAVAGKNDKNKAGAASGKTASKTSNKSGKR